jgi:hypothetical protein
MAESPGAAGGKHVDPQSLIAKHAALTQGDVAGDAAIIKRVEGAIQHSPMGWLQSVLGETDSKAASERSQVQGKLDEEKKAIADNKADAPKNAGHPPAPGPAVHPSVPQPAAAGAAPVAAPHQPVAAAAHPHAHLHAAPGAPSLSAAPAAKASATAPPAPAHTIAHAVAGAGSDAQLDGILNGYQPKSQEAVAMLGRIKQMGDVAQGFNGQIDQYIAQGGAVEHGIAKAANYLKVGKDVSAVWATNPYKQMHGVLGGMMTGLSAVRTVCELVGTIAGKLGLVLTVVGLLGMIFPPIGVAVSGIARILNVVAIVCSAVAMVLSGILTGLNGVSLAKQISAGATAEEKAATADLMMSEANETASEIGNMAMVFGPRFMKGLLGNSKGLISGLFRRAKATIGRVSLKLTGNVQLFANRIVRKLGMGGVGFERVGGAWKDTGLIARTKESFQNSRVGKAFYGAPKHLEAIQEKMMARYGNTPFARGLDRVGAWSGSVADRFDIEEHLGKGSERLGGAIGGIGHTTRLGRSMAEAADQAELETRKVAMQNELRDATHLEESRWNRTLAARQAENPTHLRDQAAEAKFVNAQKDKVRVEHEASFEEAERKRVVDQRVDAMREQRYERAAEDYAHNKKNGYTGEGARDEYMNRLHDSRARRFDLEKQLEHQDEERRALLAKTTRSSEEEAQLQTLNGQLQPLDDARRINKLRERELGGMAAGTAAPAEPEVQNWWDVAKSTKEALDPALELAYWRKEDAAWESAEKFNASKPLKWDKSGAKKKSEAAGGKTSFEEIEADERHAKAEEFSAYVRRAPQTSSVSTQVRGMLSPITTRVPAAPVSRAPTPGPAKQPAQPAPAPAPDAATAATPAVDVPPVAPQVVPQADAPPAEPVAAAAPAPDAGGAEVLPYWPALIPEFDHAAGQFDWMRKVAVEFRKAQIEGKQKAVDTLAVYGRYKEYAKLRQQAAQAHQQASGETRKDAQDNVTNASQSQAHASAGEQKQGEAKGAAQDRAAVDLPEPESRGFWDRILGAVKRWAKNKAAQLFGWIQEKIASVVLKGLCGVSMGDLREYAGALRRQQLAAHGVADGAAQTAGQAEQASVKLGNDANKEAQSAADAIGECDRNIVDADHFMQDITSFEQQLSEEKAHAQAFIAQIQAAVHTEQAQKHKAASVAGPAPGGPPAATTAATPGPAPGPAPAPAIDPTVAPADEPAGADATDPNGETDVGHLHAASALVTSSADSMASQLEARADASQHDFALALTNRTGKDAGGKDLQDPAKKGAKQIIETFKEHAAEIKRDMEGLQHMSLDPSTSRQIADTIIQAAEHLEHDFHDSQQALDELFARTYQAIKDGKHTLKNRILEGDNAIGHLQSRMAAATDHVAFDTPT